MTNYIEEMMMTAGVEQKITCKPQECFQVGMIIRDKCPCDFKPNQECLKWQAATSARLAYPDFTAEKQLEIIKLIGKNKLGKDYHTLEIDQDEIDVYYLARTNREDKCKTKYVSNKDFTQALAQLTTELMNAGELDKVKVKEILQ